MFVGRPRSRIYRVDGASAGLLVRDGSVPWNVWLPANVTDEEVDAHYREAGGHAVPEGWGSAGERAEHFVLRRPKQTTGRDALVYNVEKKRPQRMAPVSRGLLTWQEFDALRLGTWTAGAVRRKGVLVRDDIADLMQRLQALYAAANHALAALDMSGLAHRLGTSFDTFGFKASLEPAVQRLDEVSKLAAITYAHAQGMIQTSIRRGGLHPHVDAPLKRPRKTGPRYHSAKFLIAWAEKFGVTDDSSQSRFGYPRSALLAMLAAVEQCGPRSLTGYFGEAPGDAQKSWSRELMRYRSRLVSGRAAETDPLLREVVIVEPVSRSQSKPRSKR